MPEKAEQASFLKDIGLEKDLSATDLSATENFIIDPIFAVIQSRQSQEASHQRIELEQRLDELVSENKISDRAQLASLCYWDGLAQRAEEVNLKDAYSPSFMNNPQLNPASIIGDDTLNQLSIPRAKVNLLLLSVRMALMKQEQRRK